MLAEPVERAREQEVADLVAAEVEDQRAPVGVRAAARVGVLVERGAVEARERPVVAREVRGHPVEDHADARAVQAVDERAEVVGRAEARVGREVGGDLVAPRAGERMRHHRHQLDVREAELADVRGELRRRARVVEVAALERRAATSRGGPRRSRSARASGSALRARREPLAVAPACARARRRSSRCPGGAATSKANGSVFRRSSPACVRISNL